MHTTAFYRLFLMLALVSALRAQEAKVVEKEGRVVITKSGAKPSAAEIGMGLVARDKLGTGESSRAVLKMSEKWFVRVDEETDIEIVPAVFDAKNKDALQMALGGAFIYSREAEGEVNIQTPSATGGLRGTQLVVRVSPGGKTEMQVLEGEVDLANEFGRILLKTGEAGEAEKGRAPRKTAVIETRNLLQWALYYPAVLQPDELSFSGDEPNSLKASLEAYRQGDVLAALDLYPKNFPAVSTGAKLYHAAVLIATGRVNAARTALQEVPVDHPGRRALERMFAAVQFSELPAPAPATTAGEALANSYYLQSRSKLEAARDAAKHATELAPQSGFTWTRLAELEFSFGRTREALADLEHGLKISPRNAQALALQGFLLSADNRIAAARAAFQAAVDLDGGLGSAWLGLGLTKIKQGQLAAGSADLQTAATVEPTRSFFYSYHGKALSLEGHAALARKDFDLAKQLDPNDPTPWLYSAILTQQENRYNEAIHDLQESIDLNDNRRVYRSKFLLDQDSAVRSSNLAKIYQNNGMDDLAVREATNAVEADYTNSSAHLFLADSFDALRDPKRRSLRYETAWFNEQLLAYLLAPVGGGPLSQFVSQQEYSKLLAADGFGGSLLTEWRDHGYFEQKLSVFGNVGKLSAGLDFSFHDDRGDRANDADLRRELYGQLKYQVTADDIFYSLMKWQNGDSGDLQQNYANTPGNLGLHATETQDPGLLLVGWNHRWAPGVNTLFLGGRLSDDQKISAPGTTQLLLQRDSSYLQPGFLQPAANGGLEYTSATLRNASTPPASVAADGSLSLSADFQNAIAPFLGLGPVTGVFSDKFDFATERKFEIYSAEVQHIWQTGQNTLLVGGRWQGGPFDTTTHLDLLHPALVPLFTSPAALQQPSVNFQRQSLYAYDFFNVTRGLTLIAGASWDKLKRPDNFRNPPVNSRQDETERTNAKLGFTFTPSRWVTIRGAYTEALGGETFDESVRLEPVQFAGFNQAFRTVISESLVGSVEAPVYKNRGLSAEGSLPSRTWWSASYNLLREDVSRTLGSFDILSAPVFPHDLVILPAGTTETLAYREEVYAATVNQLIGTQFAVGAGYRQTRSQLHDLSPQIPVAFSASADRWSYATLHELSFTGNWNSPTGWYVGTEANWYSQDLSALAAGLPVTSPAGDDFWQLNAWLGFRFHHNLREISAGVLNLGDTDYNLSPLNYTSDLPRFRTVFVRCRLSF